MKKTLPKIKKSLKSFILEEDAKVIDKTTTKIALTASFLAISTILNSDDANAKGHHNHSDHTNVIAHEDNGAGENLGNDLDETKITTITAADKTVNIEVPPKQVTSAHGNHYNHANGSGKS